MAASPAPSAPVAPAEKPEVRAKNKKQHRPRLPLSGRNTRRRSSSYCSLSPSWLPLPGTGIRGKAAKSEQVTDDAYVRGDLTPLSTKVAGIVRAVHVSDYQQVRKGDLLVELQDNDYQAQVDQANAGVAAAKAAIYNNLRQRELQDARIAKALAGIDQAKAQIAAAQAGKEVIEAGLVRARSERKRQEALYQTHSTTQQKLEAVVADEESLTAQLASREADLAQARTGLRSSELSAEAERLTKNVLLSQEVQLQADLRAKQASLAAASVNLGYTKIYSPGDGTVGERQVRPGQLVSPGTQVISFVDVTKWVQANYRETQLTNVKVGDPAEIRIDAYPGQSHSGQSRRDCSRQRVAVCVAAARQCYRQLHQGRAARSREDRAG